VHRLTKAVRLTGAAHSGTRWSSCSSNQPAVISGGIKIPAEAFRRVVSDGSLVAATVSHDFRVAAAASGWRTLFVGHVRANRTRLNASALLGDLRVTPTGYVTERPVPWWDDDDDDAEATATATAAATTEKAAATTTTNNSSNSNNWSWSSQVELNYFQQFAPWQAQRCPVVHAQGHEVAVAPECYALLNQRLRQIQGLPRNRSYGRSGCDLDDPVCGGLQGNPLGSGLPLYVENVPLIGRHGEEEEEGHHHGGGVGGGEKSPAVVAVARTPGTFWFSGRRQTLYYVPTARDMNGTAFVADVMVPVSEGLITVCHCEVLSMRWLSSDPSLHSVLSMGRGTHLSVCEGHRLARRCVRRHPF